MFVEKKRLGVPPRLFTANGDANGTVTVSDGTGFFVKQVIQIQSDTLQPREYEIKRFINRTTFKVGPKGASINTYSDISEFLLADNARISAPEQNRPGITKDEHERAVYAEEPIVGKRVVLVDDFGEYYTTTNPLPVIPQSSEAAEVLDLQIFNISLTLANTDYVFDFPTNIRKFDLKIRDASSALRVYKTSGGNFFSINRGSVYSVDNVRKTSLSMIFQATQPNSILEVACWVKV